MVTPLLSTTHLGEGVEGVEDGRSCCAHVAHRATRAQPCLVRRAAPTYAPTVFPVSSTTPARISPTPAAFRQSIPSPSTSHPSSTAVAGASENAIGLMREISPIERAV